MKRRTQEIRMVIMRQVDDVGKVAANEVAKTFQVTRQAVFKNIGSS
jgi:predicted transcriptional regulator